MNGLAPSLLDKKYRKLCMLGQGSYGSVYLYQDRGSHRNTPFESVFQENKTISSEYFAVKIYKKPNTKSEGIDFSCLRQITCLQLFEHNNLMNCIEVLYNHKKQSAIPYEIAAVMNFHLELNALLQRSNEEDKKRIVKQIVQGIDQLHSNYYFHRDLKPDNIFISREGYVKLADFGFTKEFGTPYKKYTYNACTIEYRAPEVFMGTHYYTEKSDIWSLGCVIAFIFGGKSLFEVDGNVPDIDILSQIFYLFGTPTKQNWPGFEKFPIKYQFKAQMPKDISKELGLKPQIANLLQFVMKLDPVERPSAQQILQHIFFKQVSGEPFNVLEIYQDRIDKLVKDITEK